MFNSYTIGQLDGRTVSAVCVTIIGNRLFSRVISGATLSVYRTGWQSVLHSIHIGRRLYGLTSLLAYVIGLDILLRQAEGISCVLLARYVRECK